MDLTTSLTLTVLAASLGIVLLILRVRRPRKLPPQPSGNLIFGYALNISKKPYQDYERLAKELGDVFCFRIFHKYFVMLNSYEAIKEAFVDNGDWLSGRSQTGIDKELGGGGHGVVSSQGELWKEQRRFSLGVLKDFGLGKSGAEKIIQDELEYFRAEIAAQMSLSRSFDPKKLLVKAVSNVICSIVFSERCGEDAEFEDMIEKSAALLSKGARSPTHYAIWPIFKFLPGDYSRLKSVLNSRSHLLAYVTRKYKKHAETFDPNNIRDFIDAFIAEMRKSGSESRGFYEKQLCQTMWDFFLAGTETTTTTLLWALVFLAKYPEVQRKAHDEIDQVIGDSKLPGTADHLKLRFVDAFICETQRFATVAPIAVPHTATETRNFRGYEIEAGTMIFSNIWNVHRLSPCWIDPYNFNPQNFLDADGNLVNTTHLIPFGLGKRSCLGESLARQELFVFLTGILQRFEIESDPTSPLPEVDVECKAVVRAPSPFRISFKARSSDIL